MDNGGTVFLTVLWMLLILGVREVARAAWATVLDIVRWCRRRRPVTEKELLAAREANVAELLALFADNQRIAADLRELRGEPRVPSWAKDGAQ